MATTVAALIMTQQAGSAAGASNLNCRPVQQTAGNNHSQQQHSHLLSLDNGTSNNSIINYASSALLQSTPSAMLMSSTMNDHHLTQHHATLHDIVQHRLSPSKGSSASMHVAGMKRERDHTPNATAQPPAEVGTLSISCWV